MQCGRPTGREDDDLAAARDDASDGGRVVAGGVHHDEAAFGDPLSVLIPMPDLVKKMFDDLFDPNVATFFSVIIAAPILEEAIFRGIILNGLLKNYPPQTAIIASAAIFWSRFSRTI